MMLSVEMIFVGPRNRAILSIVSMLNGDPSELFILCALINLCSAAYHFGTIQGSENSRHFANRVWLKSCQPLSKVLPSLLTRRKTQSWVTMLFSNRPDNMPLQYWLFLRMRRISCHYFPRLCPTLAQHDVSRTYWLCGTLSFCFCFCFFDASNTSWKHNLLPQEIAFKVTCCGLDMCDKFWIMLED